MKPSEQIIKLFGQLSYEERIHLIAQLNQINNEENAMTELVELVQKLWKTGITPIITKEGIDHAPLIHCEITLPNGKQYKASGKNQKIAKQLCAEQAIQDILKSMRK